MLGRKDTALKYNYFINWLEICFLNILYVNQSRLVGTIVSKSFDIHKFVLIILHNIGKIGVFC